MIDALHFELAVQVVPAVAFVGVDDGAFRDTRADEIQRLAFGAENRRD